MPPFVSILAVLPFGPRVHKKRRRRRISGRHVFRIHFLPLLLVLRPILDPPPPPPQLDRQTNAPFLSPRHPLFRAASAKDEKSLIRRNGDEDRGPTGRAFFVELPRCPHLVKRTALIASFRHGWRRIAWKERRER